MASPLTLRIVDEPEPHQRLGSAEYDIGSDGSSVTFDENGISRIEHEDGSVTFGEGLTVEGEDEDKEDFYRNLADRIDDETLTQIASDLLTGINADLDSRKDWLDTRATGIRLLGLKLEEPRGDLGTSSAPLEGMSTVRHPLLLEATVRFQATARGELLPAAGPVKIRNDLPMRPDVPQQANPLIGDNGGPPLAPEGDKLDDLGAALEKDFNHYLTVTATEYVPDTDRMLFYIGFGGDGFKKVYNCPLRRRPVSESVDAEDLIASNSATDLYNCGRVTHRIKMRPSVLRRMQILGAYRDVDLGKPNPALDVTAPEKEKANIGGYKPQPSLPRDADYEIYECYCELDLKEFAPEQFKGKGLPLPYVVTIEKHSRQVLEVKRNWREDDDQCLAKRFFVQFPFIRGLGFYGLGLIHLLGNITIALTAIVRIMIDSGMFANFPGFLFAKTAGRQNTNQLRVPPGGGFPVDVPPNMRIQDAFMPMPYKEPGAAFINLAKELEQLGQRLGQTADINIGEGKQDVPVGTTMALIEQSTKIIDSVHKRLHAAQSEEFALLKERFREDPEAFWRHNRRPSRQWTVEQFTQALEQRELVPVADPNNPTSLHRIAKATIIDMLVQKYPQLMNAQGALKRIFRVADIDSDGLLNTQPAPPPPDPRMAAVQAKSQAESMKSQIDQAKVALQAQMQQAEFVDKQKEREFKAQMQQFEMYLEQLRVQAEMVIHAHDLQRANAESQNDMAGKQAQAAHQISMNQVGHQADVVQSQQRHDQQMREAQQRHEQQMQFDQEHNAVDLEHKRKIAEAKAAAAKKPKPSGDK